MPISGLMPGSSGCRGEDIRVSRCSVIRSKRASPSSSAARPACRHRSWTRRHTPHWVTTVAPASLVCWPSFLRRTAIALIVGVRFRSVFAPLAVLACAGTAYVLAIHIEAWGAQRAGVTLPQEADPVLVVLLLGVTTDYSGRWRSSWPSASCWTRSSSGRFSCRAWWRCPAAPECGPGRVPGMHQRIMMSDVQFRDLPRHAGRDIPYAHLTAGPHRPGPDHIQVAAIKPEVSLDGLLPFSDTYRSPPAM